MPGVLNKSNVHNGPVSRQPSIERTCTKSHNVVCSGVARICCKEGQRLKLCHGALTLDFGAGCSSCSMTNSFVTNAVLIERALSCWHLRQLILQTTQYLGSWLSDLEVEGDTCDVTGSLGDDKLAGTQSENGYASRGLFVGGKCSWNFPGNVRGNFSGVKCAGNVQNKRG